MNEIIFHAHLHSSSDPRDRPSHHADERTVTHFRWSKGEDIINQSGGDLAIRLYSASEEDNLEDSPVTVSFDGRELVIKAGRKVVVGPGESICLPPRLDHEFWGATEPALVGEVSLVNDDHADNCFFEPVGRFLEIEEDEAPFHPLVADYPKYCEFASACGVELRYYTVSPSGVEVFE